jgi:uncharacterized membrane protein YebE (DUF533 family)
MASALDMLGSLLQGGMTKSTPSRIENSLSERGIGASGGILDQILGRGAPQGRTATSQAATAGTDLGGLLSSVLGGGSGLKAGGLGALAGAILGGGAKGAIGGGALALLGSMALQAMRAAGGSKPEAQIDPATRLAAGLRPPANQQEEKEVESVASVIVKGMINAAKADGQIDEREAERIASSLCKNGGAAATREELINELRKPMDTDGLIRAVPNQQVAAEVYAASLLAVELDTEAERRYLEELARRLRLDAGVVRQLHAVVGTA